MGQLVDLITAPEHSVDLSKFSLDRCALLPPDVITSLKLTRTPLHDPQAQHNRHLQDGSLLLLSPRRSCAAPLRFPR